jgi:hypothetical protein
MNPNPNSPASSGKPGQPAAPAAQPPVPPHAPAPVYPQKQSRFFQSNPRGGVQPGRFNSRGFVPQASREHTRGRHSS